MYECISQGFNVIYMFFLESLNISKATDLTIVLHTLPTPVLLRTVIYSQISTDNLLLIADTRI